MNTSLTWLDRLIKSPSGCEWQQLSDVYEPLIIHWVTRAGVAQADRLDLVQQVFIVVVQRVGEFEHQHPGAFRGWLRAILANQLKKYFRENAKNPCLISLNNICDPNCDESGAYDREHDEYLAARAMRIIEHEFEPTTWLAFRLQVIDDKRPADVALEVGITVNAAIKAKSRVLKRLRQALSLWVD